MPLLTDQVIALARSLTVGQVEVLRARRGLTQQMLSEMPADVLRKLLGRLRFHDLPRMRAQFRYDQSCDHNGIVPPAALLRALTEKHGTLQLFAALVAGMRTGARPAAALGGIPAPTAGLDPGHAGWTALGPGNIGGRIRSIVIDPRDSRRLWAGSVGGGVWQSRDAGARWAPVDDLLANLAVSCMAIDKSNPNILYAGMYTYRRWAWHLESGGGNTAVYRSVDGGTTWERLSGKDRDRGLPKTEMDRIGIAVAASEPSVRIKRTYWKSPKSSRRLGALPRTARPTAQAAMISRKIFCRWAS
jgi:hypothetical protein